MLWWRLLILSVLLLNGYPLGEPAKTGFASKQNFISIIKIYNLYYSYYIKYGIKIIMHCIQLCLLADVPCIIITFKLFAVSHPIRHSLPTQTLQSLFGSQTTGRYTSIADNICNGTIVFSMMASYQL